MDEEQSLRSRRATREAHKVELEREIRKRPIRSSRAFSIAAGSMIGFSIICWTGLNSDRLSLLPWVGLFLAWIVLTVAVIFALGRAWERGRIFGIFFRD